MRSDESPSFHISSHLFASFRKMPKDAAPSFPSFRIFSHLFERYRKMGPHLLHLFASFRIFLGRCEKMDLHLSHLSASFHIFSASFPHLFRIFSKDATKWVAARPIFSHLSTSFSHLSGRCVHIGLHLLHLFVFFRIFAHLCSSCRSYSSSHSLWGGKAQSATKHRGGPKKTKDNANFVGGGRLDSAPNLGRKKRAPPASDSPRLSRNALFSLSHSIFPSFRIFSHLF